MTFAYMQTTATATSPSIEGGARKYSRCFSIDNLKGCHFLSVPSDVNLDPAFFGWVLSPPTTAFCHDVQHIGATQAY